MYKNCLFLIFLIILGCGSKNDPQKMAEIIYFNKSNDIIERIEIKLIEDETHALLDIIELNKEINIGDSLIFKFNTENFIDYSHHSQFETNIYFKNQEPIMNNTAIENTISGYISSSNTVTLLLYIANKNMLLCGRNRIEYPNVNLENSTCDLTVLE